MGRVYFPTEDVAFVTGPAIRGFPNELLGSSCEKICNWCFPIVMVYEKAMYDGHEWLPSLVGCIQPSVWTRGSSSNHDQLVNKTRD